MLTRTLAALDNLLDAPAGGSASDNEGSVCHPDDSQTQNLLKVRGAITQALEQPPLPPPVPVDSNVDMLLLELEPKQAQWIVAIFADPDRLTTVPLDALQGKRKNPWGGFREAWVEHYNHQVTERVINSAINARGNVEMAETEVHSEVAGTVWKVLVAVGDTVSKDQEIMILESMKMEIPVDAPCAGTVASVLVAPEEGIEEDQVLLIIES